MGQVEFTKEVLSEGSEVCREAAKVSMGWRGKSACFVIAGNLMVAGLFGKSKYEAAPPITNEIATTPEIRASVRPEKRSFTY